MNGWIRVGFSFRRSHCDPAHARGAVRRIAIKNARSKPRCRHRARHRNCTFTKRPSGRFRFEADHHDGRGVKCLGKRNAYVLIPSIGYCDGRYAPALHPHVRREMVVPRVPVCHWSFSSVHAVDLVEDARQIISATSNHVFKNTLHFDSPSL